MSDRPRAGAVVYAKDLQRVSAFYGAVTGAAVIDVAEDHVALDVDGFVLTVVAIPAFIADTFEIASPPERREDAAVKVVLPVADVAAVRATAAALGGVLDPADREWTIAGVVRCDGHDPEGNVYRAVTASRP
jgi:extradiol dioxygenase family protein